MKAFKSIFVFLCFAVTCSGQSEKGILTIESRNNFSQTLDKIEAALKNKGYMIFTRIDHAEAAKSVNLKMPQSTVIIFGNPKMGTPQFIDHPVLAIDLPLKLLVWDSSDGKTFISYNSAEYVAEIFERHNATLSEENIRKAREALKWCVEEATSN